MDIQNSAKALTKTPTWNSVHPIIKVGICQFRCLRYLAVPWDKFCLPLCFSSIVSPLFLSFFAVKNSPSSSGSPRDASAHGSPHQRNLSTVQKLKRGLQHSFSKLGKGPSQYSTVFETKQKKSDLTSI